MTSKTVRPPRNSPRRAWLLMLQAHRTLVDRTDRSVKNAGNISLVEYEVLSHLSRVPDRRFRMIDIANMLLVSRSGVSRLVRRLEKAGYVRLEDSVEDRRVTYTVLTDKGYDLHQQTYDAFIKGSEESLAQHLSDADLEDLARILQIIIEGNGFLGIEDIDQSADSARFDASRLTPAQA